MEIDHLFKYAVGRRADGSLFWYARGEASPEPIRELTEPERLALIVAGVRPEWSGGEPVKPARLDPRFSLSLSAEQCDVLLSGEEAIKRHLPRDLAAEARSIMRQIHLQAVGPSPLEHRLDPQRAKEVRRRAEHLKIAALGDPPGEVAVFGRRVALFNCTLRVAGRALGLDPQKMTVKGVVVMFRGREFSVVGRRAGEGGRGEPYFVAYTTADDGLDMVEERGDGPSVEAAIEAALESARKTEAIGDRRSP